MEKQITDVTIEEHINTHYKEYAYNILSLRGIPSKYDALIPVQRLLLLYAPEKLKGTNVLIGDCIGSEIYHHGDAALSGAINRLCRTFDNSYALLTGDGFFGNGMDSAAAPRYTKVRANKEVREMIKKYEPVNEYNVDGDCRFINLDVPIGLCMFTVGIAIAYRSQILPRKYEDLKRYVDGDNNVMLKPYFTGFKGKISRNPKNDNAWIISSDITIDKHGNIIITDLPPMMRYDTFLNGKEKKGGKGEKITKGLSDYIEESPYRVKIINSSKTYVNIKLKIDKKGRDEFLERLRSITSISVSEEIVFADENGIIRYDTIKDYLDDFKIFRNRSILKKMEWDKDELTVEMMYNGIKASFIVFMTEKKRTNDEVSDYLDGVTGDHKYSKRIRDRLKLIPGYKLTDEEVNASLINFKRLEKELRGAKKAIVEFKRSTDFETHSKARNLARVG